MDADVCVCVCELNTEHTSASVSGFAEHALALVSIGSEQ